MTNEEYNKIIIDFFSNAYLQLCLQKDIKKTDILFLAKQLTNEYSEDFNDYLGKDFIYQLDKEFPELESKLKNYPEQFWNTSSGKNYMENLQNNIITEMSKKILGHHLNNEKIEAQTFNFIMNDVLSIYKKDIKLGKKQIIKIRKELTSNIDLKSLPVDCLKLFNESLTSYAKDKHMVQMIIDDLATLLK